MLQSGSKLPSMGATRKKKIILDVRGVGFPGRLKNFLLSTSLKPPLMLTQLSIQWVSESFSLGVKLPGREADHSSPTTAEVKKMWVYTSTPTYAFMA
jgi:hypothetical protein